MGSCGWRSADLAVVAEQQVDEDAQRVLRWLDDHCCFSFQKRVGVHSFRDYSPARDRPAAMAPGRLTAPRSSVVEQFFRDLVSDDSGEGFENRKQHDHGNSFREED